MLEEAEAMLDSFNPYRQKFGMKPVTEEEEKISKALLRNSIIAKSIGAKMLTDKDKGNNFLGYLLMASSMNGGYI